ncbi:hypothetical protein QAD02_002140 [Eretmocerus hayati]|uniref:Uncharacterized protein n=1 Tax=Eretmocerus hayati TaxID=131215 RepID=A0ACC2NIG0_9HYME|nr:hypothetical protein QAD02_002140 [Eretmocerus hayati]
MIVHSDSNPSSAIYIDENSCGLSLPLINLDLENDALDFTENPAYDGESNNNRNVMEYMDTDNIIDSGNHTNHLDNLDLDQDNSNATKSDYHHHLTRMQRENRRLSLPLKNSRKREQTLRRKTMKLAMQFDREKKRANKWKAKCYRHARQTEEMDAIFIGVRQIGTKGQSEIRENSILSETLQAQLLKKEELLKDSNGNSVFGLMISGNLLEEHECSSKLYDMNSQYYQH